MITRDNKEYFMKSYKEIKKKIIDYKFLLYQYSGEANFKLVELLDLKENSEESIGVRLKIHLKLNIYINILIITYSNLKEVEKSKYKKDLEELINNLYQLYFQLDLEGYKRMVELLKFHNVYEELSKIIKRNNIMVRKIIKLSDEQSNKYELKFYDDGLKIHKNSIFMKGYYCGLSEEEVNNIDLLEKYRW